MSLWICLLGSREKSQGDLLHSPARPGGRESQGTVYVVAATENRAQQTETVTHEKSNIEKLLLCTIWAPNIKGGSARKGSLSPPLGTAINVFRPLACQWEERAGMPGPTPSPAPWPSGHQLSRLTGLGCEPSPPNFWVSFMTHLLWSHGDNLHPSQVIKVSAL